MPREIDPNGRRAAAGLDMVLQFSDCNHRVSGEVADGMRLDITDLIADLLHLGDRYGHEADELLRKAQWAYHGDAEDGPPAALLNEED